MTTYIYGASDDLVEFEGDFREEYMTGMAGRAYFLVRTKDGKGVRIEVNYGANGTWMVGAAPLDDGEPIPWNIRYAFPDEVKHSNEYSAILAIDTPEGIVVDRVDKHGRELEED